MANHPDLMNWSMTRCAIYNGTMTHINDRYHPNIAGLILTFNDY